MGIAGTLNCALAIALFASVGSELLAGVSILNALAFGGWNATQRGAAAFLVLLGPAWLLVRAPFKPGAAVDEDRFGTAQFIVALANCAWLFTFLGSQHEDGGALFLLLGIPASIALSFAGLLMVVLSRLRHATAEPAHGAKVRRKRETAIVLVVTVAALGYFLLLSTPEQRDVECGQKCKLGGFRYSVYVPAGKLHGICHCSGDLRKPE